jgi:hypothetical protein
MADTKKLWTGSLPVVTGDDTDSLAEAVAAQRQREMAMLTGRLVTDYPQTRPI